jgi:flagellar export protein FliJ
MAPKFSLQSVLDFRHGKVELLEVELGKMLSAHLETQSLLVALQEYQTSILEQLSVAQTGEIDLIMMNLLRLNVLQIARHIDQVQLELKKQEREITAKRTEMVKAKQSEETLETLKRNRHEIYIAEQVQIESQVQDDIYIARAFRNHQQEA